MTEEINAEEDFQLTEWKEFGTDHDMAIGACESRPGMRSRLFIGSPPVSQQRFVNELILSSILEDCPMTYY
jgi:hypothetical protein